MAIKIVQGAMRGSYHVFQDGSFVWDIQQAPDGSGYYVLSTDLQWSSAEDLAALVCRVGRARLEQRFCMVRGTAMTQISIGPCTPRIGDTVTAQGFDHAGQVDFIELYEGEPMYSVQFPRGRLPFRGEQLTVCNEPNYAMLAGYNYVIMFCLDGDIDVVLAPSYDQALDYVRSRAEVNDWSSFSDDQIDLPTATLEELNSLYRGGDDEGNAWVRIDPVSQLGILPLGLK